MRYTLDFGSPLPPGWATLAEDDRQRHWTAFIDRVGGFRPGVTPESWPAIAEPTFDAVTHAATRDAEWRVPVYPNGDYYIFAREGFAEGTFGHPWEQTLCVFGERLVATLGRTLATWLPQKRINGQPSQLS